MLPASLGHGRRHEDPTTFETVAIYGFHSMHLIAVFVLYTYFSDNTDMLSYLYKWFLADYLIFSILKRIFSHWVGYERFYCMIKLGQINMVNIHYNCFACDCYFCHHDTILIDHKMNSQRKRQNGSTTKKTNSRDCSNTCYNIIRVQIKIIPPYV